MGDQVQLWANIAQILSLILAVIVAIIQVVIWVRKNQIPVSSVLNKIRPFLPFVFVAALFFWIGTTMQLSSGAIPKRAPAQPPVTAVTAVTAAPVTALPVTAVTAVTAIPEPQPTPLPITVIVTATPASAPSATSIIPAVVPLSFSANSHNYDKNLRIEFQRIETLDTDKVRLYFRFLNNSDYDACVNFDDSNSYVSETKTLTRSDVLRHTIPTGMLGARTASTEYYIEINNIVGADTEALWLRLEFLPTSINQYCYLQFDEPIELPL